MDSLVWKRLPGKSRRYYNTLNPDETISRRQYDERYGTLKAQGFKTYEEKAKKYQPDIRELRPARGRASNIPRTSKIKNYRIIGPLSDGKLYRTFEVSVQRSTQETYFILRSIIGQLWRNHKVFGIAAGLRGYDIRDHARELTPYIVPIRPLEYHTADEFSSELFDAWAEKLIENQSYGIYHTIFLHVRFKAEYQKAESPARIRNKNAAKRRTAKRSRSKHKAKISGRGQ